MPRRPPTGSERPETSRQYPTEGTGIVTARQRALTGRLRAPPGARNPRSPSPGPASPLASPICPGRPGGDSIRVGWGWGSHPRFAGDRGSIPIPIPDLPGTGMDPHPPGRFPSGPGILRRICALASTSAATDVNCKLSALARTWRAPDFGWTAAWYVQAGPASDPGGPSPGPGRWSTDH